MKVCKRIVTLVALRPGAATCPIVPILTGDVVKPRSRKLWPSLNPGSHFGSLDFSGNGITAYTRVQTFLSAAAANGPRPGRV